MSAVAVTGSGPKACRCGFNGPGPHPCHANGYTCGKPATHRLYGFYLPCLAGTQMKLGASDTWACDGCWASYSAEIQAGSLGVTP